MTDNEAALVERPRKVVTSGRSAVAARLADQPAGDGAIPIRSLHVQRIQWTAARAFVQQHHYLHQCSPIGRIAYGITDSRSAGRLVGVILLAVPPNINEDQRHTLEIQRMVLLDTTERNAESRVLGFVLRDVPRRYPAIRRVIAYADPAQGHHGTIYKATGFTYLGLSAPGGTTHGAERRGTPRLRTRKHKFEKLLRPGKESQAVLPL